MGRFRHILRLALILLGAVLRFGVVASAQERTNEADIGFQQYSLTNGSQQIANAYGLTLGFHEYVPDVGIFSINLAPALNSGHFLAGDSFVELKRFPLIGEYWTFRGGDFRLPGRLLDTPFSNLFYPDIAGRGAWVEATHGNRTFGFFYGAETLQAGVRVPLRIETPQNMAGMYFRQQIGERLIVGARLMDLSTDLEKLRNSSYLAVPANPLQHSVTATADALYTLAGPLKWYGEAGVSEGSWAQPGQPAGDPVSFTSGPLLETHRFTLRANYLYQNASYLPLLGYYLGDRRGPFGEIKVRPFSRLDLFASVSEYSNNVARNPDLPTFRTTSESAGASLQLPARFSLSGNVSQIALATRQSAADVWQDGTSQQVQVTLARPVGRHSVRLAVLEFLQRNNSGPQRQKTVELGDTVGYRRFSLGGEVRAQQMITQQSQLSVFFRGTAQVNLQRFSAYANIESGSDLANRTLFATSATSTTVFGGTMRLWRDWNFSGEVFRNNLITSLNPESVFVLQGQGVAVPTVLSTLNQWSLYFRISKHLQWGATLPSDVVGMPGSLLGQTLLKGSVEGFVREEQHRGVEGISVALDGATAATTDSEGRFRFDGVGEGARKVGLALNELPADYDPGTVTETTVVVRPGKVVRADLDVVVAGYSVHGLLVGPEDASLDAVVVKLLPTDRYTTPDREGRFSFYNVKEGNYQVAVAENSLPEFAELKSPAAVDVNLGPSHSSTDVRFEFEVHQPEKPVRKIAIPARVAIPAVPARVAVPAGTDDVRQPVLQAATPDVKLSPPTLSPQNQPPPAQRQTPPVQAPKAQPRIAIAPAAPAPLPAVHVQSKAVTTPSRLYNRGRDLIQAGDFTGAVSVLTDAIEADSSYALAYNSRGYAQLRLLNLAQAVFDFNEAIRLNPAYANAYQNRAAAKKALGDSTGAKTDLEKAIALH